MLKKLLAVAAVNAIVLFGGVQPAYAGGLFVTGHDPDYHSNPNGPDPIAARGILNVAVDYVTEGKPNPRILVVTSRINPGGNQKDTVLGITAAGFTGFDVASAGGQEGTLDVANVNFYNYDAIIVGSDVGGWLRQEEVDLLVARKFELETYVDAGGGLVVLNESGNRGDVGTAYQGVQYNRYGFVPLVISEAISHHQHEGEFQVTPAGAAIGLTNAMVNGNWAHSYFVSFGVEWSVADMDPHGRATTLIARRVPRQEIDEPPTIEVSGCDLMIWPPNHKMVTLPFNVTVTDDNDPNPQVEILVFSDEDDFAGNNDNFGPDAEPGHRFTPDQLPLKLRAERDAHGDGRVYLVVVVATDGAGNVATHGCTYYVPKSQSAADIARVKAQAEAAHHYVEDHGSVPPGFVPVGEPVSDSGKGKGKK
ncbi:MAG: hypothetical protein ACK47B_22910 [Armatimonadota bacterium]